MFHCHLLCQVHRQNLLFWLLKAMLIAPRVTVEGDEIDDYKRRGTYQHFTSREKLELGKRAGKLEISSTVRYFTTKPGEERTVSRSKLFAWKGKYLDKLNQTHTVCVVLSVTLCFVVIAMLNKVDSKHSASTRRESPLKRFNVNTVWSSYTLLTTYFNVNVCMYKL